MLLAIEITLNVLWIPLLCIGFTLLGYIFRHSQIAGLRKKISNIEREMLQNHAEILALQKENSQLLDKMKNNSVPVIPITAKEAAESTVDSNLRKKLLTKPASS